jgi:hypothetical protein
MKNRISLNCRSILSLSLISVLFVGSVNAADAPPLVKTSKKEASANENQLFSKLLTAIINNIEEMGQFNISIVGKVPLGGEFIGEAKVGGMIHFSNDIDLSLDPSDPGASPAGSAASQNAVASLIPKIQLKMKGLFTDIRYGNSNGNETMTMGFFGGYDKVKKSWVPKPMVASVYNKINKGLSLSLSSVEVARHPDPQNAEHQLVSGKCKAEHRIYDFTVDKQVMKSVRCEFSGFQNKDGGYQIDKLVYSDQ